jgi:nucleotide-binding universal stress UspA family protein
MPPKENNAMFEKIVAAIDSDPDRGGKVVSTAGVLAQAFNSEVLVVHVRELERPAALMGTARPGALPPLVHVESEEAAKMLVDGAVARLRGSELRAAGLVHPGSGEGSTAKELVEIASSYDAKLIVVGDRGARVSDLLLGGVAHKIVQLAPCSVILVR